MIHLNITFHKELQTLLPLKYRELAAISHNIHSPASIKDVIESLRIPHTEIGSLIVNGDPVDFSYQVRDGDQVIVTDHRPPVDLCTADILRTEVLPTIRFMVDVNVAKLCSLLRMAGFDTTCPPDLDDGAIAGVAAEEQRILLSRDRGLLMRKIVAHGHLVRAQLPEKQLEEIIVLYGLQHSVQPFSRCMSCNGILQEIEKAKIIHRLEPLTKKYYHSFYLCPDCKKIYWSGSHKPGMRKLLSRVLKEQ